MFSTERARAITPILIHDFRGEGGVLVNVSCLLLPAGPLPPVPLPSSILELLILCRLRSIRVREGQGQLKGSCRVGLRSTSFGPIVSFRCACCCSPVVLVNVLRPEKEETL